LIDSYRNYTELYGGFNTNQKILKYTSTYAYDSDSDIEDADEGDEGADSTSELGSLCEGSVAGGSLSTAKVIILLFADMPALTSVLLRLLNLIP
jgi:hypothetical protein